MNDKLNVNTVLCKSYDSEQGTINNMFNVLVLDENDRASFTLVSFINLSTDIHTEINLHYFIIDKQSNRSLVLGSLELAASKEDSFKEVVINEFSRSNIKFLNRGIYEVRVYRQTDDEKEELKGFGASRLETSKFINKLREVYIDKHKGELVCQWEFKVK